MQAKGFTFGAHSLDHPLYAGIEPEERLRQTLKSLEIIENQVGMTISAFAFPFTDAGMELDFFQQIREFWRSPLLTFGTAGAKKDDAPKHLQRFAMERTTLGARKVVSAELALSVLRKTVGRQTVQRK
jgi:peptidoglycan/xylan/chitin deacetylase (PgdA/CDA1 family)